MMTLQQDIVEMGKAVILCGVAFGSIILYFSYVQAIMTQQKIEAWKNDCDKANHSMK